jgi:LysM repeat protein
MPRMPIDGGTHRVNIPYKPSPDNNPPAKTHTAAQRQSVGEVAREHGVKRAEIIKANPRLNHQPNLAPKDGVEVPQHEEARARRHTVRDGETLNTIAGQYNITEGALREENGFEPHQDVYAGEALNIPDGEKIRDGKDGNCTDRYASADRLERTQRSNTDPVATAAERTDDAAVRVAATKLPPTDVLRRLPPGEQADLRATAKEAQTNLDQAVATEISVRTGALSYLPMDQESLREGAIDAIRSRVEDSPQSGVVDASIERVEWQRSIDKAAAREAQIEQVALEYAPILVLPEGKYDLPGDPQEYLENSRLRIDRTLRGDKQVGDNTNDKENDNFDANRVAEGKSNEFLDLDNGMRGKLGREDAPVFYEFHEGKDGKPPTLTYHIFYPYNDAPKGLGVVDFNHEGDWERVTYELDPATLKPTNVVLSAHNGSSTVAYDKMHTDPQTQRPLIFAATGSHANYAEPGGYSIAHGAARDWTAFDTNRDGKFDNNDDLVLFDTGTNLQEVTSQPWYPKDGGGLRWGEIGETDHSSGPRGPSEDKGPV